MRSGGRDQSGNYNNLIPLNDHHLRPKFANSALTPTGKWTLALRKDRPHPSDWSSPASIAIRESRRQVTHVSVVNIFSTERLTLYAGSVTVDSPVTTVAGVGVQSNAPISQLPIKPHTLRQRQRTFQTAKRETRNGSLLSTAKGPAHLPVYTQSTFTRTTSRLSVVRR